MRRFLAAAVVALAGATAADATSNAVVTHKLVVAVKRNLAPPADQKLAVLVLVRRPGGAPAGAVATAGKPLTVLLASSGLYRVTAEIDSACKGSCKATSRISGSADHKLEVVPSCRLKGSSFVCSALRIVKLR